MKHNIPDDVLDMPLWTLLDHLQAPPRIGASLRKLNHAGKLNNEEEDDEEDESAATRASLRYLFQTSNPVWRVMLYRGMGRLSTKWLFDTLAGRYQLEFNYDWTCHMPDARPLDVLLKRLDEVETRMHELKSEWRSLKAIIGGKQRRKA